MILSDLSVRRPVFATVISLLLIILGLTALLGLPVRQYPNVDPPVVSIETTYRGASAEVVETKITQVIEDRIAGLEGIVKLTSQSRDERSVIRVEFSLNRDVDAAANDIRDRVARVAGSLPPDADPPEVAKVDGDTQSVMFLNLVSDRMSPLELTDYAERFLVDRFSTVEGVARVRLAGARRYAMRIWLERQNLAAHGLTVNDIERALRAENVELPAGRLESNEREFTLRTSTGFVTPDDFRALVVGRGSGGQLVRLGQVAQVQLGAENERNLARTNGSPGVSLAVEQLSTANTVEVSRGVRAEVARVNRDLPAGMELAVHFDRAQFIEASMREVVLALLIAISLVLIVIYLFLGTIRATLVPAVVVPVALVATFAVISALGFSINTLTLLGLVLAVGLVVDDAIVVLENIYRRIELGQPPLLAALEGAREIGFAVVATTLVLVAVFVPLSFLPGEVGRLFSEFGITLAAAVLFSSLVALSLSPAMCSQLFRGHEGRSGLARRLDTFFRWLAARYRRALECVVARPWWTLGGALVVSAAAVLIFRLLPAEYTPQEDRGSFWVLLRAPEGASFAYTDRYARQMEEILLAETGDDKPVMRVMLRVPGSFGFTGEVNTARAMVVLKDWQDRTESTDQVAARVRARLAELPGVRTSVILPQSLGLRGAARPVRLVLGGPDYEQLRQWRDMMLAEMEAMPELLDVDSNYQERKPQFQVRVDRDRAAVLGVSLADVGRTLETMMGSRIVTTYIDRGREYNVILQGRESDRVGPDDLANLYVRSAIDGGLVPLANLVTLVDATGPNELNRFDRMRAITLDASLAEGVSLGRAIDALEKRAHEVLPAAARVDWDGVSRDYRRTGGGINLVFLLALVIVFLVLAAQFESFVHPLVIMVTVPLALTGALVGLWIFGSSINIFTQIGGILLIGLAAKNGVLIVEFANQLRDRGQNFQEALVDAAVIRLRPILMTSASTTFGALPLLLATGAGAETREPIGIVIVFGVTVSAALTLFVVPALYAVVARRTRSPQYLARAIERLRRQEEPAAG